MPRVTVTRTSDNSNNNNDNDAAAVVRNATTTTPQSRSAYVDRVIAEIIDTERAYVSDLDQIIHVRIYSVSVDLYTFSWLLLVFDDMSMVKKEHVKILVYFCAVKVI